MIAWRIPQDNQRVMLFEKLEYVVSMKESMEKQLFSDIAKEQNDKFDQEVIVATHEEELRKFHALIGDLKTLYMQKLDEYGKQLQIAKKESIVGRL